MPKIAREKALVARRVNREIFAFFRCFFYTSADESLESSPGRDAREEAVAIGRHGDSPRVEWGSRAKPLARGGPHHEVP